MTIAQYRAWAKAQRYARLILARLPDGSAWASDRKAIIRIPATFLDDAAEVEEKESTTGIIANYVGGPPSGAIELSEWRTVEKHVAFVAGSLAGEQAGQYAVMRWLDIEHVKKVGTPAYRRGLRYLTASHVAPKAALFAPPVYALDISSGTVIGVIMPVSSEAVAA